jgi:GNAT superfamily N-acetyltransferase
VGRSYAPAMEWQRADGYRVSDDASLLEVEKVHQWLSTQSYWAQGRPLELVVRSVETSLAIGCYAPDGAQVGFCRWVTDRATFGWLCDVFVDGRDRGKGIGVFMVGCAVEHPSVKDLRLLLLATRDAHGLYERFGFALPTASYMEKRPGRAVS